MTRNKVQKGPGCRQKSVKGYKVFNPDWTCRGKQYTVGETATQEGELEAGQERMLRKMLYTSFKIEKEYLKKRK